MQSKIPAQVSRQRPWLTARLKKDQEAAASGQAEQVDAKAEITPHYAGSRILVVDDAEINLQIAKLQLETVGLVVDVAEDGVQVITQAQQAVYASYSNGHANAEGRRAGSNTGIRQMPAHVKTPIIAMIANAFAEDKALCMEAGMDDFLTKPIKPGDLYPTLFGWLEREA